MPPTKVTSDEIRRAAAANTSSSSEPTNSSSDSDESTSEGSSSASSSTSGDSSSQSNPPQRGHQANAAAAAPTGGASSPAPAPVQQQQQGRYVHLNADLRFERPDNEYIPLPPVRSIEQSTAVLRRISMEKQRYPEGRHRMLDYFRVAVEMFVVEVRREYQQQFQSAQRNGKALQRFTWRNTGELAICFACCCDMLKLLYDGLQPGPLKPLWDGFVSQLTPLLMIESRVPAAILTEQTYHVKYMDWQKGGTRYGGDQSVQNVRFPSAQERRRKIETYLRTGAGYKIAVQVEPTGSAAATASFAPAVAAPRLPVAVPPPFAGRLTETSSRPVASPTGVMATTVARAPVKLPLKQSMLHQSHMQSAPLAGAGAGPRTSPVPVQASTGVKQMPPGMRHLFWLSVLAHVKGGAATRAFPDERLEVLPGMLRLCEMTETTPEMRILMDVLAASSSAVQTVFERLGGLLSFRRFAAHFIRSGEAEALMQLVEQLARWRVATWGATSQQAWQTGMDQRRSVDLTWLRSLPLIPAEKRAAWGAVVLVVEQRFIFRAARPDDGTGTGLKRPRVEGETGELRAVLSDNVDMQRWVVPRVNVFSAVRLPVELRMPPLCSRLEEDTVKFLNAKRTHAEEVQVAWRARLEQQLAASSLGKTDIKIPLWYDPYELLCVVAPDS